MQAAVSILENTGGTNHAASLTLKHKGDRGSCSKCSARPQMFFSRGSRGPNATKICESSLSIQEWEKANGSFCQSLFLPTAKQSPGDWDTPAVCPGSHNARQYLTGVSHYVCRSVPAPRVSLLWSSVQLQAAVKWTKACQSHLDGSTNCSSFQTEVNWTRVTAGFVDHLVNET